MSDVGAGSYLDELDIGRRLSLEVGTELQLQIDGVESRLQASFVGMQTGKYLIVTAPSLSAIGGISVKLYGGNRVIVRYIFGGSVFGFETTIMEAISSPVRLLFLTYPAVITERNIRSNHRVNTTLPARITAGGEAVEGTITDISIAGCLLEARTAKLPAKFAGNVGAAVEVALHLPAVAEEIQVSGELRNVRKDSKQVEFGIAFGELSEDAQLAIDGYVKLSE